MKIAAILEYGKKNLIQATQFKSRSLIAFAEAYKIFEQHHAKLECASTLANIAMCQMLNETHVNDYRSRTSSKPRINAADIKPGHLATMKAIACANECLTMNTKPTTFVRHNLFDYMTIRNYYWNDHALSSTLSTLDFSLASFKLTSEQEKFQRGDKHHFAEQQASEQTKNQFPDCSNILIAVFILLLEYCTLHLWSLKLQKGEQTARDIVEKTMAIKRRIDFELFRGRTSRALTLSEQLMHFVEKEKSS
jgi:hypothetical protein